MEGMQKPLSPAESSWLITALVLAALAVMISTGVAVSV